MNKETIEIQEDDLHAYVDNQLPADKVSAVEALIHENPEVALQVQQWQQQNEAITKYFDKKGSVDIPEKLDIRKIALNSRDVEPHNPRWHYAMVASALMLISGSVGWFSHEISQSNRPNASSFVSSAISAHQVFSVETLHPVEVGANERSHLVTWLSKRIDHPLKVPELQEYGYKLLGGRLLSMQEGRPAAQFMFEDSNGQRITLLVSKNPSYHDRDFLSIKENGVNSFYWMDSNVAYSVTSKVDQRDLYKLSLDIYQQTNNNEAKQIASL